MTPASLREPTNLPTYKEKETNGQLHPQNRHLSRVAPMSETTPVITPSHTSTRTILSQADSLSRLGLNNPWNRSLRAYLYAILEGNDSWQ